MCILHRVFTSIYSHITTTTNKIQNISITLPKVPLQRFAINSLLLLQLLTTIDLIYSLYFTFSRMSFRSKLTVLSLCFSSLSFINFIDNFTKNISEIHPCHRHPVFYSFILMHSIPSFACITNVCFISCQTFGKLSFGLL